MKGDYMYVATVGKTPEKVLIGLRTRLNIKKVCLVGSSDAEVRQCMKYVESFAEKLGYIVETIEADAFDMLDVADHVNAVIRQNKEYSVVVNVSSGTRVMTIGALIAAYMNNSEVIYVPQQVDRKTPLYIEIPPMGKLLESVLVPKKVLTNKEEILSEMTKRVKEDHPALHIEALQAYIKNLIDGRFEFAAWDTRFERYPRLIYVEEKTEAKVLREDLGPYQMVRHFDARCSRCKSWFTFPLEIGVGYLATTAFLSQGEPPPKPETAPPPLNSYEYANLLLKSRKDFYCPRCTLLLGLRNVINELKKTKMIV